MTLRLRSGQVLVELLLALGVMVLTVVTLVQLTTKSVSNVIFSRRQSTASGYATQAIEWVRQQRDILGWDSFVLMSGTYCLNSLAWQAGACAQGSVMAGTDLSREAVISGSANERQVDVVVKWNEGGRPISVKQTSILSKY